MKFRCTGPSYSYGWKQRIAPEKTTYWIVWDGSAKATEYHCGYIRIVASMPSSNLCLKNWICV